MLEIVEVNHTNHLSFHHLLLPTYLEQLEAADSTLWGISLNDGPVSVGILLAKLDFHSRTANIVHFSVGPERNTIFIMEQLLSSAESMLADEGILITDVTVSIDKELEAVSDVFFKRGWFAKTQVVNKYILDVRKMRNDKWIWQIEKPAHLNVFHWSPAIEKEFENSILVQDIESASAVPYRIDVKAIDIDTSFVLYSSGKLAGWCLSERIDQNMLLTINVSAKRSVATRVGGMMLYAELVKKAIERNMQLTFLVDNNNRNMLNVINRRFEECIIQKSTILQFTRQL